MKIKRDFDAIVKH